MTLPLLSRSIDHGVTVVVTPGPHSTEADLEAFAPPARLPSRAPGPGEQYRFHVDMRRCIGCKCCVVACNEQNGNPAAIMWRRVGEIEGGWYPQTARAYLSMGCNHCLEPTCMIGCPVGAYTKDAKTGIVLHDADTCIGCQYCVWNCSYGVPQYNPERGVVGKCDLCHNRLGMGQAPACVAACPTGAIAVEIVNVEAWRSAAAVAGSASGMPVADQSVSTTRVTLPVDLPPNARPVELARLAPEEPHWPLIVMTVLTQLSVGAFAAIWLLQLLGAATGLGAAAMTSLLVASLALAASTLHLGRPVHAWRAVRMWKRSWLSREVLLFTAFAGVASVYAAALWFGVTAASAIGALTVALGIGGLTASACLYRVPSRPAWNTPFTLVQFQLTAAVLGPLFAAAIGTGNARWMAVAATIAVGAALATQALCFFHLSASDSIERQASARLLATVLAPSLIVRGGLLALAAITVPLLGATPAVQWLAVVLALASELTGRYLFFVSAVPRHIAAPYLAREAA